MPLERSTLHVIRAKVRSAARKTSGNIMALAERANLVEEAAAEPSVPSPKKPKPKPPFRPLDVEPSIAIIVPARNEDRFLRPCLRSIREQHFNSFECIVVDDGSSDRTREIADDFAERDSRFRVVSHTKSLGLATARNTGIELTGAPYLTFLDADDFLYQGSLKERLRSILDASSENVAGSYCDWQPTREREGRTPPKRSPADKPPVVGFPSGPECPFIATAPLIRREVVEALGGFNESLPTAEDFDLWVRVLRAGYTFVYTPQIGVAYRQKASGMVFTDTAMHARASDAIIASQYKDLSDTDDPPAFARPLSTYAQDVVRARRLLRSYALSEVAAESDDQERIGALFPESLALLAKTGLDVSFELNAGLARAARAVPSLNEPEIRRRTLARLVDQVLSEERPRIVLDENQTPAGQLGSLGDSNRAEHRSLAPILPTVTVSPATTKEDLGVLFVPMARYHAIEMRSLAAALRNKGIDSTFLVVDEFAESIREVLAADERIEYENDAKALPSFSGVYMMNDWGMTRDLILEARIRSVPTFARVEGVQDYRDVDTGRIRLPYQTAEHVLAQGDNDVRLLNHKQVTIVGNARIENLFTRPERTQSSSTGRAVINSNFTYGVFSELRNAYVESAIRACLEADLDPVISQHPADAELPAPLLRYRSDESMSDLLHTSDVLISRFSTVPFEAMAVGTPFVYFRPRSERVETFDEPDGAYEIVYSASELAECLPRVVAQLGSYRSISETFFRSQISITEIPSDERAASVVAKILGS